MPLILTPRIPTSGPDGYEIAAKNSQGDSVRVVVTREAINAMASGPGDYLAKLEANRKRFDEIAIAKYDASAIEAGGHIIIQPNDLMRWG